jgi:putative transposase
MPYNPDKHHRQSIRLPEYDYSYPAAYFVTACTLNREHFFGAICDGILSLSKAGKIAHRCWASIPSHFSHVELGDFIIMPNHIHGILLLTSAMSDSTTSDVTNLGKGAACCAPTAAGNSDIAEDSTNLGKGAACCAPTAADNGKIGNSTSKMNTPILPPLKKGSLPTIMRSYKSAVTKAINENCPELHFAWHRNYYEHVIRSERTRAVITEYIQSNPYKWKEDRFYTEMK